jgi:hypothetical protein
MEKIIIAVFMTALMSVSTNAQNLQLHYDLGRHIYSTEEKTEEK